jgi:hypothetical protein
MSSWQSTYLAQHRDNFIFLHVCALRELSELRNQTHTVQMSRLQTNPSANNSENHMHGYHQQITMLSDEYDTRIFTVRSQEDMNATDQITPKLPSVLRLQY